VKAKEEDQRPWAWHIADRLKDESNPEVLPFFLGALRENIHDGYASLRRALLAQVLFALLFFVVIQVAEADVTVLGFKVTDPSLIAKTLPVVVAYLAYEVYFLLLLVGQYRDMLSRAVPLYSARLGSTNAHRMLYPPTPSFMAESFHFGGERRPRRSTQLPPTVRIFDGLVWAGINAVLLATVIFLIYAYVSLWRDFGGFDVVTIVSAAIALVFIARVVLLPFVATRAALEPPDPDIPD
jgi:hypothetical protein